MSKELTKDDVITNKKEAIKALNKLIESFINDSTGRHLKKANLLSYWLKDYVKMISHEEKFEPTKNIAYKRGNIVKLNFGFNIGCEYGGLHYGVVLDNKNDHSSPVITVIPLTSLKSDKEIHSNSVELGNEIYRLLKIKYDTIQKTLAEEQNEIKEMISIANTMVNFVNTNLDELNSLDAGSNEYDEKLKSARSYLDSSHKLQEIWEKKLEHNQIEQEYLTKIGEEISRMKKGSVALVNQITTISKIRIFDPRNIKGVLSGISLSAESMEKINQKIKELYIF